MFRRLVLFLLLLATVLPAEGAKIEDEAGGAFDRAMEADRLVALGLYEEGTNLARAVLNDEGDDLPGRSHRGMAFAVLGFHSLYTGNVSESIDYLDEAVAAAEAAGDEYVLAVALSRRTSAHSTLNDAAAAEADLERASNLSSISSDPWVMGEFLIASARFAQNRGRLEDAASLFSEAADRFTEAGRPARASIARVNEADLLVGLGRPEDALVLAEENLSSDLPNNLFVFVRARAEFALGDLDGAEDDFTAVIEWAEERNDLRNMALSMTVLASIAIQRGDLIGAENLYREAIDGFEASEGLLDAEQTRIFLSDLLVAMGRFEEARNLLDEVLSRGRDMGDPYPISIALFHRGNLEIMMGNYAEAVPIYGEALEAVRSFRLPDPSSEATIISNRAFALFFGGQPEEGLLEFESLRDGGGWKYLDYPTRIVLLEAAAEADPTDPDEAESYLTEAGNLAEEAGLVKMVEDIEYTLSLIRLRASESTPEGAAPSMERGEAAAAVRERGEEALISARESGDRIREFTTLVGLADAGEAVGDDTEVLGRLIEAAEVLESLDATSASRAAARAGLSGSGELFGRLAAALAGAGRTIEALEALERSRSSEFGELIRSGPEPDLGERSGIIEEERILRERAAATGNIAAGGGAEVSTQAGDGRSKVIFLDASDAAEEAGREYREFLDDLVSSDPATADLVSASTLSADEIRSLLPEGSVFISYLLSDAGDHSMVFIVSNNDISFRTISMGMREAEAAVAEWRTAVESGNDEREVSERLYDALFAPFEDLVPEGTGLIISPHGPLHYLSFPALYDGEEYLVERHPVSIVPSARVMRFLAGREPSGNRTFLGFANPSTELADLPYAEEEVGAVENILASKNVMTEVSTGSEASEARFRSNLAGKGIIHLACHGILSQRDPLLSSLRLARGGGEDGSLEVREVFGLPLDGTDLIVLSACETGLGELNEGDEIVGLVRAFFYSGAPTIIASEWEVPDRSTAELMSHFYASLEEGASPRDALRDAQIRLIHHPFSPSFRRPLSWAAFQVYGDVRD